MAWVPLLATIYGLILVATCLHILAVTQHANKAIAYLLFAVFIPVLGIGFYFTFGINYWRKRYYYKKSLYNGSILEQIKKDVIPYNTAGIKQFDEAVAQHTELAAMLSRDLGSPLTRNNQVKLLQNGEEKFPELLLAISNARHHIHLEYYIYEYDKIGTAIIELLIKKARQGVEVRIIYDDFGSPTIKKETEQKLRAAGASIFPFHKVRFYLLANRLNYRNHRKIVVIDGCTAFVGGINVSDKYINSDPAKLYWRDTHLRLDGPAVYYLQYLFMTDWNFCSGDSLAPSTDYFDQEAGTSPGSFVQIAASGPDSILPSVLYSILQAIYLAKKEILITTPYFIPGDSITDALRIAAISGLTVKLLVPGISDSKIVNAASRSYYRNLLEAGVEIYLYQKGFVHAKTLVTDAMLCIVGTANMDYRSFELNFEVNTMIYDSTLANVMRNQFFTDLKDAVQIDKEAWLNRPWYRQLPERVARLFSPIL